MTLESGASGVTESANCHLNRDSRHVIFTGKGFLTICFCVSSNPVMRQILDTEDHVQIPPLVYSDPFYRITYLIKEEIRKYKWTEGEKGRKLTWDEARQEWTEAYREKYEKFLIETLSISEVPAPEEPPAEERHVFVAGHVLPTLPQRPGG